MSGQSFSGNKQRSFSLLVGECVGAHCLSCSLLAPNVLLQSNSKSRDARILLHVLVIVTSLIPASLPNDLVASPPSSRTRRCISIEPMVEYNQPLSHSTDPTPNAAPQQPVLPSSPPSSHTHPAKPEQPPLDFEHQDHGSWSGRALDHLAMPGSDGRRRRETRLFLRAHRRVFH